VGVLEADSGAGQVLCFGAGIDGAGGHDDIAHQLSRRGACRLNDLDIEILHVRRGCREGGRHGEVEMK